MAEEQRIDATRLKRDIINATGTGAGKISRRALSLAASDGKNPDLVRDLISRGQDKRISYGTAVGIARELGKPIADYLIGDDSRAAGKEKIKIVGAVQAGIWRERSEWPIDDQYDYEAEPSEVPGAQRFGLVMEGLSMDRVIAPDSILECLRVAPNLKPQNGDIVIAERRRNNLTETTCKRLIIHSDGIFELLAETSRPELAGSVFIGKPDEESITDDEIVITAVVERATKRLFRARRQ